MLRSEAGFGVPSAMGVVPLDILLELDAAGRRVFVLAWVDVAISPIDDLQLRVAATPIVDGYRHSEN